MARFSRRGALRLGAAAAVPVGIGSLGLTRSESTRTARSAVPAPARDFLRGMTVSCPTYGPVWGSPLMQSALQEMHSELGVEWVAIHPYARVRKDGDITFEPAADTGFLERAVRIAREQGVRLFWKPHLAYWGAFAWRGEIAFSDEAAWARFFDGYRRWIVDQAAFAQAHGVRLFSLGLEYERAVHRPEWRAVIEAVRAVFQGELTYGANWDGVDRVPFWSDVDLIGVQAYFPLVPSATDPLHADALRDAWRVRLEALRAVSKAHGGRRVLFTEIGYARSTAAAHTPWKPANSNTDAAIAARRLLLDTALEHIPRDPLVRGMFWWKWIPGPNLWDRDFSMRDDEARAALAAHWHATSSRHVEDAPR